MRFICFIITLVAFSVPAIAQKGTPCPCCTENHRAFDFWIGEWTVTQNGNPAGSNTISVIQDSCVLVEEWVGAGGAVTGTSYNFYNSNTGKWEQLWLDNQGNVLKLTGYRKGNEMIMKSEDSGNTDEPVHTITWTLNDDGTVRQLWKTTNDRGENWTISFDGLYRRK